MLDRPRGKACPLRPEQQYNPVSAPDPRREVMNRDGGGIRDERRNLKPLLAKPDADLRPGRGSRKRHVEDGSHRGSQRFPVERIAAPLVQHDSFDAKSRCRPKEAANIVRIPNTFEPEKAMRAEERVDRPRLRALRESQAPAMKVEAGDRVQQRLSGNVNRAVERGNQGRQRGKGRRRQKNGVYAVIRCGNQPFEEQSSFSNEQPLRSQPDVVADTAERVDARIIECGDLQDHTSLRTTDLRLRWLSSTC